MKNKKIYIGVFGVLLLVLCLIVIHKSPWKTENIVDDSQNSTISHEENLNDDKEDLDNSDTSKEGTSSYDEFTSEIENEINSQNKETNTSDDSTANSSAIEEEVTKNETKEENQDSEETNENNSPDEELENTLDVSEDTNHKYGPIN